MKIELIRSDDVSLIIRMRREYLDSLICFQELFIELLVRKGTFYLTYADGEISGYIIVDAKGTHIAEFFQRSGDMFFNREIIEYAGKTLGIKAAYCKTFDMRLVSALNMISQNFVIDGILFRRHNQTACLQELLDEISERPAVSGDFCVISENNDYLFESDDEIRECIESGSVTMFEDRNGKFAGLGLYQRIAYDYRYVDIGMMVNPECRKKGYGAHIIRRLTAIAEERGDIPICGCGFDNIASLKTLKKAGYIPEYELLEYSLQENGERMGFTWVR